MTCSLSLGPNSDLELTPPSGRRLYIPIGPNSTEFLQKILLDATREPEGRKRYIGAWPTQAEIEEWTRQVKREEQIRYEQSEKYGIKLVELEISL